MMSQEGDDSRAAMSMLNIPGLYGSRVQKAYFICIF